jgi:hypothetical protein
MRNFSHGPIVVRLAMRGLAPALSAVTYRLLALASRLMLPSLLLVSAGMQVGGRISAEQMAAWSDQYGVEFALVYRTGGGKNGGGGSYWLYSGAERSVDVPVGADVRLIYHTRPGGTPYASRADMDVLRQQFLNYGSPQRSSQIVLPDGSTVRFGEKWGRDGKFGP